MSSYRKYRKGISILVILFCSLGLLSYILTEEETQEKNLEDDRGSDEDLNKLKEKFAKKAKDTNEDLYCDDITTDLENPAFNVGVLFRDVHKCRLALK